MRTLIRIENANCSYCIGTVQVELLERPLVHHVEMNAAEGCMEVDHDHDDPAALIELLGQSLHGAQVADNGEIVMVMTDPELTRQCSLYPPDQQHP